MPHEPDGVIDFGATPAEAVALSGDTNTDAMIAGSRWTNFDLTYSFIDDAMDYSIAADQAIFTGEMSAQQQTAATAWFGMFASVSGLTFTLLDGAEGAQDEDQEAAIRMANGTAGTAFGYYPHSSERGGDIIFGGTGDNPDLGDFDWVTVGHEIGHAMGLAHGHTASGISGIMDANVNSQEYSIMTYNSYANHDRVSYNYSTVEPWGSPQTLMMYDITALQHLYGANFGYNSGNTVYTFDTATGEMAIDGVGQGTPGANRILRTIWDGDGIDTYDFSNYTTNLNIDLTPGGFSDLDVGGNAQRSDLGRFGPGAGIEMARGHVFNALQYQGDVRSLIERAFGGSGNDTITGNDANNTLIGNDGNDILNGGLGNDFLNGGSGEDTLNGGMGNDTLEGGAGADILDGGDGTDLANYFASDAGVVVNIGGAIGGGHATGDTLIGIENLFGSTHDDTLAGTDGVNQLYGLGGRDILYGYGGSDTLVGGDEVGAGDFIVGGSGSDFLYGEGGDDTIYGGADADLLDGGNGRDILYGDEGDDLIYGGDEAGAGDFIVGGLGNDNIFSQGGDDTVYGGEGNDTVNGFTGRDIIYGDAGNDTINGGDEVGAGDFLSGGTGDDIINGGAGDDALYGEAGADQLSGGDGSDALYFDVFDTLVSGGAGYDYALLQGAGSAVLNMTAGQIEYAVGGDSGDILSADGYNAEVTIYGGGGNDSIYAGTAGSYLLAGDGADQVVMGTASATDHMLGGTGADTFWMRDGGGTDYIYDFEDGVDIINATLLTSNTAQGVANFTINTDYVSSGWYGVGYEGGNILWIQAGQGATIDDNDFIFPGSGNDPAPEAIDMFDFSDFGSAGYNDAPLEALVAEYDIAIDMTDYYHDMDGHYGQDAGHWNIAV